VELSAGTGLHRTTVKRLLETLRSAGFVLFIAETNSYRLSFRVQQLSDGFRAEAWVSDVARPLVKAVTERILWPCTLLTRERDSLVVRESTHHFSPLSFHSGTMGATVPMVRTAAGRAYLAFCGSEERNVLLSMLRERDDAEGAFARDERTVRKLLETTRERGFAINDGDWIGKGRYGAIAVPIMAQGRVLACLDTVFSKRSISMQNAIEKFVPELLATASAIESGTESIGAFAQ
jgi:IclR family mhp operon transcriptional activator